MEMSNPLMCPEADLEKALAEIRRDDEAGLKALAALMQSHPLDPRLHFLQGSVFAGLQRYEEARRAMGRAVEIAPDFALARYQLGFLDLTSGRALDALAVWQPLGALAEDAPLRLFAEGLSHMAGDRFGEAVRLLKQGIRANSEHPLINGDIQLILDEIEPLAQHRPGEADAGHAEASPGSAVDLLLRQQGRRPGQPR
jgi:tetratricopeptide (TPR) repeat protein